MKSGSKSANGAEADARGLRVAIVASQFNNDVVEDLLSGALDELRRRGAAPDGVEVLRVPGAFELVSAAAKAVRLRRYDAVVCLGAIIRGQTPHFDYICQAVSHGLARLCVNAEIPVIFGVLTTDTLIQARARSGKRYNKGREAAAAALDMANLFRRWDDGESGEGRER